MARGDALEQITYLDSYSAVDDYTPAVLINELSPVINENGGNSRIITYEDSHHSFDSVDPIVYVPNAIAVGRRHTFIAKDGFHYHQDKRATEHL